MNSTDLRKRIDQVIKKESKSGVLKKHLIKTVDNKTATQAFDFISSYVAQIPDILDAVYVAARGASILNQFQPVFDAVFYYWEEEYDVIPDKKGLLGLTDDAYLSSCLMQKIASSKAKGSKAVILKLDLHEANKAMKTLLGQQISSQLDQMVETVFASTQFQNQLNTILNNPMMHSGLQGFSQQNLGATNPQFYQYQQHMRDMNELHRMKSDVFQGNLMSMAANAGLDISF